MEKSTSSSQRKDINSDENDSTNKNSSNHDVIDKSTYNPFTNDDVQPTTSKSSLNDSAIKSFIENIGLPPLQSENSLKKNKSEPFRYFTPDCKGAHNKILPQKSVKGKMTSEEIRSKMNIIDDRNICTGTSELCGAGIRDIMDRFNKEEDNYEAERTYAYILAASVLQQSSLKRSESDTD